LTLGWALPKVAASLGALGVQVRGTGGVVRARTTAVIFGCLFAFVGRAAADAVLAQLLTPIAAEGAAPALSPTSQVRYRGTTSPGSANKAWYFYFDQGFGDPVLAQSIRDTIDGMGAGAKNSPVSVNLGLVGVYVRQNSGPYLLGAQCEFAEDYYDESHGQRLVLLQNYLALSGLRYFGRDPSEGFLLRVDVGEAVVQLDDASFRYAPSSSSSLRLQCGVGYALPLDPHHRYSLVALVNGIVVTDNDGQNANLGDEVRVGILF
jgi:hypothetical protein